MTGEEQQQVQNIINARTKLLSEKIARQEEQISRLSTQLEDKEKEIAGLKSQLTEAQDQSRKLIAMLQENRPPQPEPAPKPKPKPSYLVSLLRQHFGYDSFRPGQEEVINAILASRDVLCSMPDNYGRSICYRLPALLMPGLTLVLSSSPAEEGPKPEAHSGYLLPDMPPAKKRSLMREIKNGTCKILYSGIRQVMTDDVIAFLKSIDISMTVILASMNAPDIMKDCKDFTSSLGGPRVPAVVFAHSTSPAFRQDIMKALRSPLRIITGFKKPDVTFRVLRTEHKDDALREIITQKKDLPGVIYCSTPETAYKLREALCDILGFDERVMILPGILYHEVKRQDIRFIIHYELPASLASYSQEINPVSPSKSECIILVSRQDFRNSDKQVIKFCEAKSPADVLMSYLGEDEKFTASSDKDEPEKLIAEDFSDFDFGNSNEAQKEAITSSNGALLILAGPGTGKTHTLVQRTVFLIQKRRVKPENIMLAAFTDKASRELITRISEELASRKIQADVNSMYAGTFHSICETILKDYADFTRLGKNFRILDEFDQAYLILQNMNRFMNIPGIENALVTSGKWKRACELRSYINTLSEELADPEELARDSDEAISALGQAMRLHDEILGENNSVSYSALLVETYRLLRDNPEILDDLHDKIKYLMIDEYQDTNYVQEQLIFMIAGDSKNICAAGDDDQSLYRFRGAEVRNILEFPDKFAKNECKVVKLMLNYRSVPGIIKFFSDWISNTGDFFDWGGFRYPKKLEAYRPENSSCPSVMRLAGLNDREEWHEKILAMITSLKTSGKISDYSQIAFLFRSVKSNSVQALLQYLENNNISVYSPRSSMFFRRGEIHFALGCLISMFPKYLRSLESGEFNFRGREPDYITYYKNCLRNVARYIDKPAYSELKRWLLKKRTSHENLKGYTNYTYSDLLYELFAFMPFNRALDADMAGSVKDIRPARNLARLVSVIRKYEYSYNVNNISAKYIDTQFQMMMNIYLRFQIEEGLDEYEGENEAIPAGHVAFMTIHQAKGMEFPVVFLDSLWSRPDSDTSRDRNLDLMNRTARTYYKRPEFEPEDQIKFYDFWRLFYVAFSRAQDLLVLTCNEDGNTPSRYFEAPYNRLDDADENLPSSEIEISPSKNSGLKNIYSFTSHILLYETCPLQYKFCRELEFEPRITPQVFSGILVHDTLEDIHRAVLRHEESKVTEPVISSWFDANYEHLSRTHQTYLTQSSRDTALGHVMRYVTRQGSDWSALRKAEAEVSLVRDEYILEGVIDLIAISDDQTEITDFKAGTKPNININRDRERLEVYRRQLNVYAYLAERTLGLRVSRMRLYYTGETSGSPEIVYPYDQKESDDIIRNFDDTVRRIMSRDFSSRTSDLEVCSDCCFRYYCGRE